MISTTQQIEDVKLDLMILEWKNKDKSNSLNYVKNSGITIISGTNDYNTDYIASFIIQKYINGLRSWCDKYNIMFSEDKQYRIFPLYEIEKCITAFGDTYTDFIHDFSKYTITVVSDYNYILPPKPQSIFRNLLNDRVNMQWSPTIIITNTQEWEIINGIPRSDIPEIITK